MITLPTTVYELWVEFVTKNSKGSIIDPVTLKSYNAAKDFVVNSSSIKREFFKHMGHFTDQDLKEFVLHLLGRTPKQTRGYPKVSMYKTKVLCEDNMPSADWVERRQRKKVILEDFLDINPALPFTDKDGQVIDIEWRNWKRVHNFTSATWDYLLTSTPNEFFTKQLKNEEKLRRAKFYSDKGLPQILPMFQNFLKMKKQVDRPGGETYIRGLETNPLAFSTSTVWQYQDRNLPLAIIDFRQIQKPKSGSTDGAVAYPLLKFLGSHMRPTIHVPNAWLWIVGKKFNVEAVLSFSTKYMKNFVLKRSTYIPSKAERLDGITNRSTAPPVTLLFLLKRDDHGMVINEDAVLDSYSTSNNPYYTDYSKNCESKYRTHQSELRMEFYIDVLQSFAVKGENVIGICAGSKLMIAAKLYGLYYYGFVDMKMTDKNREMAKYHGGRPDIRDFCHDNSPYLGNYIRPRLVESPVLNSSSTPSNDGILAIEQTVEEVEPTMPEEPLRIDEFGTNSNTIRRGDFEISQEDFQINNENPVSASASAEEERQGKKPVKEKFILPPVVICNLSDESDSYFDLENFDYGGPEIEEGGPSNVNEEGENTDGDRAADVPLQPVKEEPRNTGWWKQREDDKARKKEAARVEKERTL